MNPKMCAQERFTESSGFVENGEMCGNEIIAVYDL